MGFERPTLRTNQGNCDFAAGIDDHFEGKEAMGTIASILNSRMARSWVCEA